MAGKRTKLPSKRNELGASLVEAVLLIALIAVLAIPAASLVGLQVSASFSNAEIGAGGSNGLPETKNKK